MNVLGVAVSMLSLLLYVFVKSKGGGVESKTSDEANALLPQTRDDGAASDTTDDADQIWVDKLPESKKIYVGVRLWRGVCIPQVAILIACVPLTPRRWHYRCFLGSCVRCWLLRNVVLPA